MLLALDWRSSIAVARIRYAAQKKHFAWKGKKELTVKPITRSIPTMALFVAASAWLSACGGESALSSGSGAGEGTTDEQVAAAITLIEPFVGVYDLQQNWRGIEADEAFLSIRLIGNDGISEAVLFDFDDIDNCIPERPSTGEVVKDPFSNRVFLNDIIQFDQAVLTLSGNALNINSVDISDIDSDGDRTEAVDISAQRLDITEIDLGPAC